MCHYAKLYTKCDLVMLCLTLENTIMLKTEFIICMVIVGHYMYKGLFVISFLLLFLSFPNVGKSSFMNKVILFIILLYLHGKNYKNSIIL